MLTPTTRDGHWPFGRTGVELRPIPRVLTHRSRFALLLTVPNLALALERNSLRSLLLAGGHLTGDGAMTAVATLQPLVASTRTSTQGRLRSPVTAGFNRRPSISCGAANPTVPNHQDLASGPRRASRPCDIGVVDTGFRMPFFCYAPVHFLTRSNMGLSWFPPPSPSSTLDRTASGSRSAA